MVHKEIKFKKILEQFIKETRKRIPVQKIILFGSHARGPSRKWSDIDIAVISPKFAGMTDYERVKLLLDCVHQIKYDIPVDVETFGYTPEEYEIAGRFDFPGVIKETGKAIYPTA